MANLYWLRVADAIHAIHAIHAAKAKALGITLLEYHNIYELDREQAISANIKG